ncbi:MAG: PKD domain-containing protein, partial [Nocardioides sp.]|uniref:PKD domain-containing protein n=1 Tax=Nocardioides sp. TaxID=35761 RepID=UPI003265F1C2
WCFHYNSHATGTVEFGPDGFLYVSAGEGAAYNTIIDDGSTSNACGDPVGEGGALRSQDLRTAGDPASLDGTVIRIDSVTGAGAPGNPLAASPDPNARRIVAYGFRNPFRFALRSAPGGGTDVYVLDVGWFDVEEINRFHVGGPVANFGWPCYEGSTRNQYWDSVDAPMCEALYNAGPSAVQQPFFSYAHTTPVTPGESCPFDGGSSVSAIAFVPSTSWPTELHDALVFGDYARNCLWALPAGLDGQPDPAAVRPFAQGASTPVMLQAGPGGDLFYLAILDNDVDYTGALHRLSYFPGNQPPSADITTDKTFGPAPLTVSFDGTGSSDTEDPGGLVYAWDLDGNGAFNDSTSPQPSRTYAASANVTVRLRVTDPDGATDVAEVELSPGNTPPNASITSPSPSSVLPGDTVSFGGTATDAEQGTLPGSSLRWTLSTLHCPTLECHDHPSGDWTGSTGSFVVQDHERPAHLLLTLRATDARGLTSSSSVRLDFGEPTSTPSPTPTSSPSSPDPTAAQTTPPPAPSPPIPPPTALPEVDTVRLVFRSLPRGVV